MAEEQEGFTFVDKRGAPTENVSEATSLNSELLDEESLPESGITDANEVYGLLGYCISLLSSVAWQKMGLIASPQTGEAKADLAQAKVAVDAVGDLAAYLEAAPEDALPAEMRRELRTLMNDLRLNYVAQREHSGT